MVFLEFISKSDMLVSFLKMAIGTILVFFSFHLTTTTLRQLLRKFLPRRRMLHNIVSLAVFFASELIGIDLLLDPLIPGQAVIYINAKELVRQSPTPYDLRVEIAVANFGGSLDPNKIFYGKFDERGVYVILVDLDWLQSYVRVKIFNQIRPDLPIEIKWEHISTWARLGFTDSYIRFLSR
jgi:hypothetical protein